MGNTAEWDLKIYGRGLTISQIVFDLVDKCDVLSLRRLWEQMPNRAFKALLKSESFCYGPRLTPQHGKLGTLLHLACARNSFEMVEFFVQIVQVSVCILDSNGLSPIQVLFMADFRKYIQIEKCCLLMLEQAPQCHNVNVESIMCYDLPLINVAAQISLDNLLNYLLDVIGVDVNSNQSEYGPPIDTACSFGCFESFEILINRGAKVVYQVNSEPMTCLHSSLACFNEKIVDYLLENFGYLKYEVNGAGYTPLQVILFSFLFK